MSHENRTCSTSVARELALWVDEVHARTLLAVAEPRSDGSQDLAARVAEAEQRRRGDGIGGFPWFEDGVALDATQLEFFWMAAAYSSDPRIAVHAEALAGPLARRGVTATLHARLFAPGGESGRALTVWLAQPNPFTSHGLLVSADELVTPALRPYAVPSTVLARLRGHDVADPAIRAHFTADELIFDEPQRRVIAELRAALSPDSTALVTLCGPLGAGRRTALAHAAGRPLIVLDGERSTRSRLAADLVALRREAMIGRAVPVIADVETLLDDDRRALVRELLAGMPGPIGVVTRDPAIDLATERPVIRLQWPAPDTTSRRRLWATAAGTGSSGAELDALAMRYRVGPGTIASAVRSAQTLSPTVDGAALERGLRHNIAERMGGLARRIEITQSWDELVLGDDTLDQVHGLVARVRFAHQVLETWQYERKLGRGTGVAALFSGPPGTGKTMVAGLVARELDLELYQVDLSQIVSKWVGETEKQLARVFDAAEEGHALLLFDEADALFGQRTGEVKSAVDRYANLEVNYLLQRVESFGGITVLTTNLDTNIDRALKRRLAAHIVFGAPDEDERATLWARLATTGAAPLATDVDFDELAREFAHMTGANIRNAALGAAFLAASTRSAEITQEHCHRAGRAEYRSMGHVLAERRSGNLTGRKS